MTLGRDPLTALSDNIILGGEGPYEACSASMVDTSNYDFNIIRYKTVKLEESFISSYVNECLESESEISATRRMRRILDVKYKKADLNKVISKKCQHINNEDRERLLILLRKFEDMLDGTSGTWNTYHLELKDDEKPVCSQTYPVPRIHKAMFRKKVERLIRLWVLEEANDSK